MFGEGLGLEWGVRFKDGGAVRRRENLVRGNEYQ